MKNDAPKVENLLRVSSSVLTDLSINIPEEYTKIYNLRIPRLEVWRD